MSRELIIGGKGSFSDFGQCIAGRNIGLPSKRTIKETVPYKNGAYDFSNLIGELIWDEREITYTFDIIGMSIQEVEEQKSEFLNWLMNVQDEDIYDGYKKGYHLHGSYDKASWNENWEQCELSVTFKVYPYYISNSAIEKKYKLKAGDNTIKLYNGGSHRITPIIETSGPLIITRNNDKFSFETGIFEDDVFELEKGTNTLVITPSEENTIIKFKYVEEIF